MQIQPIISCHNIDHSPGVENLVHRRLRMLEKRDRRITGCAVTMEAWQKTKRQRRLFRVRLDLQRPGPGTTMSRDAADGSARDDLILAVKRAFAAAEKALKHRDGTSDDQEVTHLPPLLHGKVVELEPVLGDGWIGTDHGQRVYFQRDSMPAEDWARLHKGTRLRFREMEGHGGAYAASVTIVA